MSRLYQGLGFSDLPAESLLTLHNAITASGYAAALYWLRGGSPWWAVYSIKHTDTH